MERLPLLVIAGPTACGKTRIAVDVAEAAGGEIVNADSMQIYRHVDIGTAKPTPGERAKARFHLIDIVDPEHTYSVAQFQAAARKAIREIAARGRLPILCGGTGLYVRAVVEGLRFPPRPVDDTVREALEGELARIGSRALHQRLAQVDPAAAAKIHFNDHKRIIRALEVWELTGKPVSQQRAVDGKDRIPYNAAKFVISRPRDVLYEAIERRVDDMIQAGWVEEVRRLAARGYGPELQSMRALGYGWLFKYVRGDLDLGEAIRLIKRDTRRFAKRQLTWFRHQPGFTWLLWSDETDIPSIVNTLADAAEKLKGDLC